MTCEHLETINWDAIWDRQWELTSFKGDGVDFWDTRAQLFERGPDADDYVAQFVSRLSLSPELSVLDVGCGIGTVTMALARQVRCVTALDWSPRMLEAVARRVAEQQLEHVRTVRLDWPQVQVGRDIEPHDVVLASRSLPMGNLLSRHIPSSTICSMKWASARKSTSFALRKRECTRAWTNWSPISSGRIVSLRRRIRLLCASW